MIDLDSIGAPGTAKNIITVGASESLRTSTCSSYGACFTGFGAEPISSDAPSNNANGMAPFSRRNPKRIYR